MRAINRQNNVKNRHTHNYKQTRPLQPTSVVLPTKIGIHALHIHPYLHEFFELILSN